MISVTLQFSDVAAAAHALARLATPEQFATAALETFTAPATIAHIDRPDVGAPVAQPALPPTPPADPVVAAFGGAVVQAAPLVPAMPALPTPPVPAPSAPTAATVPTAVPGAVERDSTGIVWDGRIHASTKTKTKEGVWTAKRNVDEAFRAQVVADLRGVPAPAAPVAPVAPPAALVAPQTPVAPQAPAAANFASYMAEIGAAFNNRPLDAMNAMTAALAPHGMQHVGQLAGKPELIPVIDVEFKRLLG